MGENTRNMKSFASCVVFAICLGAVAAEVYFEEDFSGDWESRWVQSENKDDLGKFVATAGINGDASDLGLQTSQDAKFYGISAVTKEFSNKDKPLVVQYSVKHEQGIDCGGAYLKLGPAPFDGKKFHGETVYNVMFGPDICGMTKRTHLIFNYKEKNLLKDKDMRTESDDPEDKKPSDWVDEAEMDDPEDKKPEGYDDIPAKISDPKATKPDDWDTESDGEWEAPQIDNPDFKGPWKVKRIKNPAYKGVWEAKLIDNPKFVDDDKLYSYPKFSTVGIDIWQVKSGTIFDNILITDDVDYAKALADKTWKAQKDGEKAMKEKADEEKDKAKKAAEPAKEEEKKEEKKEL